MIKHQNRFNEANPAQFDGVFDWDFLVPAFAGTKIQPMDLDAIVERYGRFLVFETKDKGKEIPTGQRITLEALVMTGWFTVIVLRSKTAAEINNWEVWFLKDGEVAKRAENGNAAMLVERVKRWFQWADSQGFR